MRTHGKEFQPWNAELLFLATWALENTRMTLTVLPTEEFRDTASEDALTEASVKQNCSNVLKFVEVKVWCLLTEIHWWGLEKGFRLMVEFVLFFCSNTSNHVVNVHVIFNFLGYWGVWAGLFRWYLTVAASRNGIDIIPNGTLLNLFTWKLFSKAGFVVSFNQTNLAHLRLKASDWSLEGMLFRHQQSVPICELWTSSAIHTNPPVLLVHGVGFPSGFESLFWFWKSCSLLGCDYLMVWDVVLNEFVKSPSGTSSMIPFCNCVSNKSCG